MAAKRRARRPRPDDSVELGHDGGKKGSDEEEKETAKSGETAMSAEPNEMPLKRAEKPPLASTKDAGARGSDEVSPSAPRGGVALKTKKTSKHIKKPPPASQEEDEAGDSAVASPAREPLPAGVALKTKKTSKHVRKPPPASQEEDEAGNSGDASPAREPLPAGVALKTKNHAKKKPPPVSQDEDEAGDSGDAAPVRDLLPDEATAAGHNKRAVSLKRGPLPRQGEESVGETPAASALQQVRKALTKPTSPPSSPDIAQEDKCNGREMGEMAEQEQSNTSRPQDEHRAREEEQQEKMITEQDHADDTSPPHENDSAHGEEQQEKEAANQEHVDDISHPKDNHRAPSTKPRSSETEKKPTVKVLKESWSYDDELKILNALVAHAQSHDGALPDSSHLLANLTFDKTDVTEFKLTDKIRKLRRRYNKLLLQGCPSDRFSRRLFKLSEILWGQVDEDERVEPTSRDFSVLSKLYPHLAKEVKAYAKTHSSGDLIMAMFTAIGDKKARDLDAKCKKQHIEAFKLELGQASLTNELLSALSSQITDPSQATSRKRRADKLKEPLDEQHLRRSKRFAGNTEGFKDKPNAGVVFDPEPISMVPFANTQALHLTKDIMEGFATGFMQIHPRDVWRADQAGHVWRADQAGHVWRADQAGH